MEAFENEFIITDFVVYMRLSAKEIKMFYCMMLILYYPGFVATSKFPPLQNLDSVEFS